MPIREFICQAKHISERVLFGEDDDRTVAVVCDDCGRCAHRVEFSLPYAFTDDFAIAKSYEKRKGAEPPIRGSACYSENGNR